ncbi:MAG TPA: sulfatase-like hydrolase/transferase [Chitinophagaceae bacterium]
MITTIRNKATVRRLVFVFLLGVLVTFPGWSQQARPNILWIVSEDTSPLMGCYGNAFATTPSIDRLAREGVRYTRAFAVAPVCAPARSTLITGMQASSLGTENMRSQYPIPDFIRFFPQYLREAGYYTTNNAKEDYNTGNRRGAWDQSDRQATYKNRKPGQPFFAVFNLGMTHESQVHRKVAKLNHDPRKVPIPPYHPRTPEMEHDWALFYDNMEAMDKQVGRLLRELEEAGLADSTIVFYYSDHGGVLARSKRYLFESGLRVPLIVRCPQQYRSLAPGKEGDSSGRLVSFEDFAPTVLSLAGVKVPAHMQGTPFLGKQAAPEKEYAFAFRARIDERADLARSVRNQRFRYVRNYAPQKIYGQQVEYQWQAPSIRSWQSAFQNGSLNAVQSAFWKQKPAEELYDVVADPHNITNLASNKTYAPVLKQMREEARQLILNTRDAGFIPESMKAEISATGTVYDFARSADYPLERILETAEMATSRDAGHLEKLTRRLADQNPIVRYWAATAWVVLGKSAPALPSVLSALLQDGEPAVRITAAEALYAQGKKAEVLAVLIKVLEEENPLARLQAVTVLEAMGKDALPALPALRQMVERGSGKKVNGRKPWTADHDLKIARQLIGKLGAV